MARYLLRGIDEEPFERLDAIRFYLENYYAFTQEGNDALRSEEDSFVYLQPRKIQYHGISAKLERVLRLLAEPYHDGGHDPDVSDVERILKEHEELHETISQEKPHHQHRNI